MDQESLQRRENARILSDRTSKMEVQSKLGSMVEWPVRKDGGASKPMFIQSNWESKTHEAEELEVILDTEINLNNRPLMYIDHDIQFPILTPNSLIYGQPITIPQEQLDNDDEVMKNWQRYIKRCKDAAWNRWNKEYMRSLREKHNMKNNQRHMEIAIGDVVLIKKDE